MRYRAIDDDRVFEADSAAGIVEQLRAFSFMPHDDADDFRRKMAENCERYDGSAVRPDTAETFVEDLVKSGYFVPA
jgi:hypothetical protein